MADAYIAHFLISATKLPFVIFSLGHPRSFLGGIDKHYVSHKFLAKAAS